MAINLSKIILESVGISETEIKLDKPLKDNSNIQEILEEKGFIKKGKILFDQVYSSPDKKGKIIISEHYRKTKNWKNESSIDKYATLCFLFVDKEEKKNIQREIYERGYSFQSI